MNTKTILGTAILSGLICLGGCSKELYDDNVGTLSECAQKEGYWYKDKCWMDFVDQGIAGTDIDQEVERQMALINTATVKVNDGIYPVMAVFPEQDDNTYLFITLFENSDGVNTLVSEIDENVLDGSSSRVAVRLFSSNLMQAMSDDEQAAEQLMNNPAATGELTASIKSLEQFDVLLQGTLTTSEGEGGLEVSYSINDALIGAGNSTMEFRNGEFHVNGTLGTRSYSQLKKLLAENPEVTTVVLGEIDGSVNDAVNMHTGRLLRASGLNTKVLSDSKIASGGVDLFAAGVKRIAEKGAEIGVHSWCCEGELTAGELPKDHPAHKNQLEYFTMALGEGAGPRFYFYTLDSAPFNDIYWMPDDEIKETKISTDFIE